MSKAEDEEDIKVMINNQIFNYECLNNDKTKEEKLDSKNYEEQKFDDFFQVTVDKKHALNIGNSIKESQSQTS